MTFTNSTTMFLRCRIFVLTGGITTACTPASSLRKWWETPATANASAMAPNVNHLECGCIWSLDEEGQLFMEPHAMDCPNFLYAKAEAILLEVPITELEIPE